MINTPYCFMDVELANTNRSSICALGIICVSDNDIVFEKSYLINPECDFNPKCIKIHGIMPIMVADAPTFPEVWKEISPYIEDGVVVAHNAASMEMNSICQTLDRYDIPIPRLRYICTMCASRKLLPDMEHRLHDLCDYYNIPLDDHHDALCDARACMNLYNALVQQFGSESLCVALYDYSGNASDADYRRRSNRCLPNPVIFDKCPDDFHVNKSRFCFTGDFASISRNDLIERITEKNGAVTTTVSGKTDYLIVGDDGSEHWKFGKFGDKIQKAIDLKQKGAPVRIISETDFLSAYDSASETEIPSADVDTSLIMLKYRSFYDTLMKEYPALSNMFTEFRVLKTGASIYAYRQRVATLNCLKSKGVYLEIAAVDVGEDEIASIAHTTQKPKGIAQSYRFFFEPLKDHDPIFDLVYRIARDCFYTANVEHFGCCNSFKECSKEKCCIHIGDWEYVGCEYRKNIEKGIVFY